MIKIPTVGSQVKVTVTDAMGPRMIPPQPSTRIYTGQVIKSHKWLSDREFCITGDASFAVRVIDSGLIEDIELLSGDLQTVDVSARVWTVPGSRGNQYTVTRDAQGWNCTCPGHQFRKNCRHVTELSAKETV